MISTTVGVIQLGYVCIPKIAIFPALLMSTGLVQPSGGISSYPITEVLSSWSEEGEKGQSEVGEVRVLKVVSGDGS